MTQAPSVRSPKAESWRIIRPALRGLLRALPSKFAPGPWPGRLVGAASCLAMAPVPALPRLIQPSINTLTTPVHLPRGSRRWSSCPRPCARPTTCTGDLEGLQGEKASLTRRRGAVRPPHRGCADCERAAACSAKQRRRWRPQRELAWASRAVRWRPRCRGAAAGASGGAYSRPSSGAPGWSPANGGVTLTGRRHPCGLIRYGCEGATAQCLPWMRRLAGSNGCAASLHNAPCRP